MKNQPQKREENRNRWDWLREKLELFMQPPPPRDIRGDFPPEIPKGFSHQPPSPSPPAPGGMDDSFGSPPWMNPEDREGKTNAGMRSRFQHPDAWLDEPIPGLDIPMHAGKGPEMPPPWAEQMEPPMPEFPGGWNRQQPRERDNSPSGSSQTTPPSSSRMKKRQSDGQDWEELPQKFDETETLESPRIRRYRPTVSKKRKATRRKK